MPDSLCLYRYNFETRHHMDPISVPTEKQFLILRRMVFTACSYHAAFPIYKHFVAPWSSQTRMIEDDQNADAEGNTPSWRQMPIWRQMQL